ncbi:MAG TPA: hypothetical protein VGT08_11280 [Terracidiphilus sp.]|nr:hypothetical protein [Terracidiphilus sp.]
MALGAQRAHVIRIVFGSVLVSVGSGIAIDLALTFALNGIIAQCAWGIPTIRRYCWRGHGFLFWLRESLVRCQPCGRRALSP